MTEHFVQRQYDSERAWEGMAHEIQRRRAELSAAAVPADAESVLDLGCGNGAITNLLTQGRRLVVGLDISYRSLSSVQTHRVRASLLRLPFVSGSFDAVTAFEVLEHLPKEVFGDTLAEIVRVARRYIVVSVPYRERLWSAAVRCRACGTLYHAWGHYTTWTEGRLRRLFRQPFRLTKLDLIWGGNSAFGNLQDSLYRMQRLFGNVWDDRGTAVCPACGSCERVVSSGNLLGYLLTRVIWRAEALPLLRKPAWYLATYVRRGG